MEVHLITGVVDGDVRTGSSKNKKPFVAFTVKTSRSFNGTTYNSWHSCMAWGDSVKIAERLRNGDQVQVLSNEARAEVYTPTKGKNAGEPRGKVTYTVREIEVIGCASRDEQSPQKPEPSSQPAPKPTTPAKIEDEDVPF